MSTDKIIECVPNYSEGRDLEKVEKIANAFRGKKGVKLLDYSSDKDHNRSVITAIGEPEPLLDAVFESVALAKEIIDMNEHEGQHPRIGAVDVIPFIPIKNVSMEDAVSLSRTIGKKIGNELDIPVFLYENSATAIHRRNLADIRRGQYEGLKDKLKNNELWLPDYGPTKPHATFGAVAVSARNILCAYNVNLGTDSLEIAKSIAKKLRSQGGGLRYCKAMGVKLIEKNITQVSMNLTDYTKTSVYSAFEMVRMEAKRYGVSVVGSEVIGLLPQDALIECAKYYLGIEDFTSDQVIENRVAQFAQE